MDKIKLIKEIEHIALTYEFDEVVKDCTYEEFIEDWGKDVYECIYIDYIYNEELEKIINIEKKENLKETVAYNTQKLFYLFEETIRKYPEQYMWQHKRWR